MSPLRSIACAHCGQGFRALRRDARYCSDGCRKAAKRAETPDTADTEPDTADDTADEKSAQWHQVERMKRYIRATGGDV